MLTLLPVTFRCPILYNPLCVGIFNVDFNPPGPEVYYNRHTVKKAIHAPVNVTWTECSNVNVFPHGDASPPSALTVLPSVIEKSERSVIVHGLADFILIAEG